MVRPYSQRLRLLSVVLGKFVEFLSREDCKWHCFQLRIISWSHLATLPRPDKPHIHPLYPLAFLPNFKYNPHVHPHMLLPVEHIHDHLRFFLGDEGKSILVNFRRKPNEPRSEPERE